MADKIVKNRTSLPEQEKFLEIWGRNGNNVVDAYAKSREPPVLVNPDVKTAAYRYARQGVVAERMKEAESRALAKIEKVLDKYAITEERIAAEIAKLAFTDVKDVLEWDAGGVRVKSSSEIDANVAGAISEVSESEDKEGNKVIRLKMYDKKSSLELLAKYRGMLVDRKETKSSNVSISFVIDKGDDIKEAVKTIDAEVKELSNAEGKSLN